MGIDARWLKASWTTRCMCASRLKRRISAILKAGKRTLVDLSVENMCKTYMYV